MAFRLTKQGHWRTISLGLSALADYLDQGGSPIDYDRRRATDYRDLLPLDAWRQLCRDIGFEVGGVRRHQFARALLFERLSGLPATLGPTAYAPATQELRTLLRTFETDLTPALVSQLEEHAREFLARQGIRNEPITWQPSTDIIDDLQLPGCDLRDIDLNVLHRRAAPNAHACGSDHLWPDRPATGEDRWPHPCRRTRKAFRLLVADERRRERFCSGGCGHWWRSLPPAGDDESPSHC